MTRRCCRRFLRRFFASSISAEKAIDLFCELVVGQATPRVAGRTFVYSVRQVEARLILSVERY